MNICFFEDKTVKNFYPLCYFRPQSWLRSGTFTIDEKFEKLLSPKKKYYLTRSYLMEYFQLNSPESDKIILFINSRIVPLKQNIEKIKIYKKPYFTEDGHVGIFKGTLSEFQEINKSSSNIDKTNIISSYEYIWDLIFTNEELLKEDFELFYKNKVKPQTTNNYFILESDNVFISESATIEPGVVIDGKTGPVIIDENAVVMANSVIKGPAYIGRKTQISVGSKLYGHLSIGPVCKIGGEVEESIIHGYSNKKHDGFLGHSYIGEWCNLGADTNNSDLKNNYGKIKMAMGKELINTQHQFLGLIMGDHSKTAINTSFNTGTIVGVSTNIFARGFFSRFLPSFSWVGDGEAQDYLLNKAIEVAKVVMERRGLTFSKNEEELFKNIYNLSKEVEL